jgi:hypothetical protein
MEVEGKPRDVGVKLAPQEVGPSLADPAERSDEV